MTIERGEFRVGTSGYQYDHWSGLFYPEDLPKKDWFGRYSKIFDTVEITNTFYGLPALEIFAAWRRQAPAGFCYTLKFSRYGSHLKRLKEPRPTIGTFLRSARRLRERLGPILVQLRPIGMSMRSGSASFSRPRRARRAGASGSSPAA